MHSHNSSLATTLYDLSINWLDNQLGTLILEQENNSCFLIICTYFLKLGAVKCMEELNSDIVDAHEYNDSGMDELFSVLGKLNTGTVYKTKHILDTLCNDYLAKIILKYVFCAFLNNSE